MTSMRSNDFDRWYTAMSASPRQAEIQQRTLGLPPEVESTSLLPWDGIGEIVAALAIGADDVFTDLACGRGGYGFEVARRTGAALVGVDFSEVAIGLAARRRAKSWMDVTADFRVGELAATGLPDASVAAVMCVDAMQFADPYAAGLTECARVLTPGGRLVLTGWEAIDPDDEDIPVRLRRDIGAALVKRGYRDVEVREMSLWQLAERAMWEAAVSADPAGDPALESMRAEGMRVLAWIDRSRRVLVTGRTPG